MTSIGTMAQSKDYSKLDSMLQQVHIEKIRLNDIEKKKAYSILNGVENEVKRRLYESDTVLKHLLNGTVYRGSFFGGVKIKKPDEFDIDLQLKLPFDYKKIVLHVIEPGFVQINVKKAYEESMKTPTWAAKYGGLKKFIDEKGFLIESNLREEMESTLLKKFPGPVILIVDGSTAQCRIKKSGPAFTFEVLCQGMKVDIDFVFVIYMENIRPPNPIKKMNIPNGNWWFAVPKQTENTRNWRLSFPKQEEYLLDGNNNLKFIYRLLKLLRDEEKWSLASYHICTLFLWVSNRFDKSFWQRSIGSLFVYMLNELKECLEFGEIKFFWDPRHNMIDNKSKDNVTNMAQRTKRMLVQIQNKYDDDQLLREYILRDLFRIEQNCRNNAPATRPQSGRNNAFPGVIISPEFAQSDAVGPVINSPPSPQRTCALM